VLNIIGVFVIKVYIKPYSHCHQRYYCFLLKLDIAMLEGNDMIHGYGQGNGQRTKVNEHASVSISILCYQMYSETTFHERMPTVQFRAGYTNSI
jgi:hypothetical protein